MSLHFAGNPIALQYMSSATFPAHSGRTFRICSSVTFGTAHSPVLFSPNRKKPLNDLQQYSMGGLSHHPSMLSIFAFLLFANIPTVGSRMPRMNLIFICITLYAARTHVVDGLSRLYGLTTSIILSLGGLNKSLRK